MSEANGSNSKNWIDSEWYINCRLHLPLRELKRSKIICLNAEKKIASAKEDREKADLELIIQKTKIIAFSPITSWQIEGKKM